MESVPPKVIPSRCFSTHRMRTFIASLLAMIAIIITREVTVETFALVKRAIMILLNNLHEVEDSLKSNMIQESEESEESGESRESGTPTFDIDEMSDQKTLSLQMNEMNFSQCD